MSKALLSASPHQVEENTTQGFAKKGGETANDLAAEVHVKESLSSRHSKEVFRLSKDTTCCSEISTLSNKIDHENKESERALVSFKLSPLFG